MTEAEYQVLTQRVKKLFPAMLEWFAALDATNVDGIRERWRKCLASVPYDTAAAAVERLATSATDPWPFPGDKERAAAIIADTARKMFPTRFDKSEQDELAMRKPRRSDGYRSDGTYSRVLRAIDDHHGHSDACLKFRRAHGRCLPSCDVPEIVGRKMAKEDCGLPEDGRRFDCPECRDTGFVSCLSHKQVADVCRLRVRPLIARTYSVRCHCSKGVSKANQEQWREFDAGLDVHALQDERRLIASCVAFAESVAKRGRIESFDAWNRESEPASA